MEVGRRNGHASGLDLRTRPDDRSEENGIHHRFSCKKLFVMHRHPHRGSTVSGFGTVSATGLPYQTCVWDPAGNFAWIPLHLRSVRPTLQIIGKKKNNIWKHSNDSYIIPSPETGEEDSSRSSRSDSWEMVEPRPCPQPKSSGSHPKALYPPEPSAARRGPSRAKLPRPAHTEKGQKGLLACAAPARIPLEAARRTAAPTWNPARLGRRRARRDPNPPRQETPGRPLAPLPPAAAPDSRPGAERHRARGQGGPPGGARHSPAGAAPRASPAGARAPSPGGPGGGKGRERWGPRAHAVREPRTRLRSASAPSARAAGGRACCGPGRPREDTRGVREASG